MTWLRLLRQSLRFRGGLWGLLSHLADVIRQGGLQGAQERLSVRLAAGTDEPVDEAVEAARYQRWLTREYGSEPADAPVDASGADHAGIGLCVVLMPWRASVSGAWRQRAIDAVLAQIDPNWRLQLVFPAGTRPDRAVVDARLTWVESADGQASGAALAQAWHCSACVGEADLVCLLEPDVVLHPMAILRIRQAFARMPQARVVYTDADRIDESGMRSSPWFKTCFDPDLLLSQDYFAPLVVYRTDVIASIGGLDRLADRATAFDWSLRAVEVVDAAQIMHLPQVLCHQGGEDVPALFTSDAEPDHGRRDAVIAHLARTAQAAVVDSVPEAPALVRVRFAVPEPAPSVEILIPTRDRADLLAPCLESVFARTDYPAFSVCLIDNGSTDAAALALLDRYRDRDEVRVLRDESPFNFSALNNQAATSSRADYLCLLNNDTVVRASSWLGELVAQGSRPAVGCVGARLWYDDDTVQHAGVVLGINDCAGHVFSGLPRGDPGYGGLAVVLRTVSAVSAACLLVRRSTWMRVGGFDEAFAVAFNDVDFCLRVAALGRRNVFVPGAELYHLESRSRGYEVDAARNARLREEFDRLHARWGGHLASDPYYSPHLSRRSTMPRIALA